MSILVSAGDAITAKLVEEAGFDGIWVSGFETSARLGLPDNGSITMTEMLHVVDRIVKATDLPIYVDVDSGYNNVARTAREFYNIGATGICIEDNILPKENSLWGGIRQLVDPKEQAARLAEAHQAAEDLIIIARTEALIRQYDWEDIQYRVDLYEEAEVDYLLVHTRDETGTEALQIPARIRTHLPLAIVPTKFPQMSAKELEELGYKKIIWANHTERMKIKAVRDGLRAMRKANKPLPVEKELCASLEDLRGLVSEG